MKTASKSFRPNKDKQKGAASSRPKTGTNTRVHPGLPVRRVSEEPQSEGPPRSVKRKKMPSGRGLSGGQIFVTGKKATGRLLSGDRAKPSRRRLVRGH